MKSNRWAIRRLLQGTAVATLLSWTLQAGALTVGFTAGMHSGGGLGIQNTSTGGVQLSSLLIDLSTNNQGDTFFDTFPTAPGTSPTAWGLVHAPAGGSVTLPDSASTDGQQQAGIFFSGFDSGEYAEIVFDLDYLANPDFGGGDIVNTTLRAVFSNGLVLAQKLVANPVTIGGATYSYSTVTPVPLPAAVWLFGSGLLGMLGMRRFRSQGGDA